MTVRYEFIKPIKRKKITSKERAEIFLREHGVCHICGLVIRPGEEWDVSHPEESGSLWAGGSDDRSLLKPAHREKCHRPHTGKEATQRAKEARVREKFLGARPKKSSWRKKPDGFKFDWKLGKYVRQDE